MKTTPSTIEPARRNVRDYIPVIKNAVELFELYTANIQLEIIKEELVKKRSSHNTDSKIADDISLVCELQELCKRRV